ncbi:MAG: site-specific integrase [Clostridiaceae bacterium]|nr:site-specific integrase [Clostridiaceae bacterium]
MGNKRSNGEGSAKWITKNGIKYWSITITTGNDPLTGNQLRKDIYGKTQKEAKDKLKAYQENYVKNNDNSILGDLYYEWLWNTKKQQLKQSSFEKWEGIYRNYIKSNKGLNNKKLIDIDTLQLQKITNQLLKDHTVSQIRTMNNCLSTFFKYAISINKLKHNPMEGITYPKNHEVPEEKINYITEKEQKVLTHALRGDELEGIVLIALMCGLRLGEAMALQNKDIDFDNRIININKSVKYVWTGKFKVTTNKKTNVKTNKKTYEYKLTIPKTKKSVREVPFPKMLIPILKKLIIQNKENKLLYGELYFDNEIIFCRNNGEYIDSKQPNRHLKIALKRAGIKTDIHYHSLRHIFITNCVYRDIGIKTIMNWVGHTDTKTTYLIYAEVNKDKDMKEYAKINAMFE